MTFPGQVAGIPTSVAIDSYATCPFLSKEFTDLHNIPVERSPSESAVVMGDGTQLTVHGTVRVSLKIQAYTTKIDFRVIPLNGNLDVILGDSWLQQTQALIDYGDRSITVKKGDRKISLVLPEQPVVQQPSTRASEQASTQASAQTKTRSPNPTQPYTPTGQSADPRAHALPPTGHPTLGYPPAEQLASHQLPAVQQAPGQGPASTQLPQHRRVHFADPVASDLAAAAPPAETPVAPAKIADHQANANGTQSHTAQANLNGSVHSGTKPKHQLLTALKFAKVVKHADVVHLCTLKQIMEDNPPHDDNPFYQFATQNYPDVFGETPQGLPPESHGHHYIELEPDARPQWRPMYRLSPAELQEVKDQIQAYLEKGWIRPSTSPWSAPILFAPKKDGTLRMCIDYRALNKLTVKNRYPIPRIDDLLDHLQGAQYFSTLDLQQGYHQIRMNPADIPCTAFSTPQGHFEFTVMTFGLTNAPATFQAAMNSMFKQYIGKFCLVYLDDVLIFSKTAEEHMTHLQLVLDLLRQNQYQAKLSKCNFGLPELPYLGFIVGRDGVKANPAKIADIVNWPIPRTVTHVQQFLGLCNYFRKFLQGYANLAAPLTALTSGPKNGKSVPIEWSDKAQAAFDGLKQAMSTAPVLALPDWSKPFTVQCDASGVAIGAILMQEGHPIAFESRKMNSAELNYHAGEQELLAVIHALTVWRCYLEGSEFTVVTDHNPNTFMASQMTITGRKARWSEFLQRYHFTWVYKPGRVNAADPLSRNPRYFTALHLRLLAITRRQAAALKPPEPEAQQSPDLIPLEEQPETDTQLPGAERSKYLEMVKPLYEDDPWFCNQHALQTHGVTKRRGLYWRGDKLVLPAGELREECLSEMHSAPYSGHPGLAKTLKAISRLYWWPGMHADIKQFVKTCDSCQRNKPRNHLEPGLLQPIPVPKHNWEQVTTDLVVQLPTTAQGLDAICTFVDRMSKMVHFVPCTTKLTAAGWAQLFHDHVWKLHGYPKVVISDRGSHWNCEFWQSLCQLTGTKRAMSTAYHPQTDGQSERYHRTLEDMLRHYISPTLDDWDKHLTCAEFAINNAVHDTIGTTPFFLNYGFHPLTPATADIPVKAPAATEVAQALRDRLARATELFKLAQQKQKKYADRHRMDLSFKTGDQVLVSSKNFTFKGKDCKKLLPRWMGPFKVVKPVGSVAYELELPANLKIHDVFHISLLRKYHHDGKTHPPPPVIYDDVGAPEYHVEAILDHRDQNRRRSQRQYLVRWQGYPAENNTWEKEGDLTHCADLLQEYLNSKIN
jgi:hypothetical protein